LKEYCFSGGLFLKRDLVELPIGLIVHAFWNRPGLAFGHALDVLTVVTRTERFGAGVGKHYVFENNVVHGRVGMSHQESGTLLRIVNLNILKINIMELATFRGVTLSRGNHGPTDRARMSSTYVHAVTLLSRADPDGTHTRAVDDNILISYFLDKALRPRVY